MEIKITHIKQLHNLYVCAKELFPNKNKAKLDKNNKRNSLLA